jgi:hypothetical protein
MASTSIWNLLELALATDLTQHALRISLIENCKPVWMLDHVHVRKRQSPFGLQVLGRISQGKLTPRIGDSRNLESRPARATRLEAGIYDPLVVVLRQLSYTLTRERGDPRMMQFAARRIALERQLMRKARRRVAYVARAKEASLSSPPKVDVWRFVCQLHSSVVMTLP